MSYQDINTESAVEHLLLFRGYLSHHQKKKKEISSFPKGIDIFWCREETKVFEIISGIIILNFVNWGFWTLMTY